MTSRHFVRAPVGRAIAAAALVLACSRSDSGAKAAAAAPAMGARPAGGGRSGAQTTDPRLVRADLGRIQGDSTARLWIVEVSDFQCPYCRVFHDSTYPAMLREYVQSGKVRLAYVNLPLPMHASAPAAAEAVMCAAAQGKFWEMHDALFNSQPRWAPVRAPAPTFDSLAVAVGVDAAEYRSCVSTRLMRPLIQADMDRSARAGVTSTPTFLIGDQKIEGAAPIERFRPVIDAELARVAKGATPKP